MEKDRESIGLTHETQEMLNSIYEYGWFSEGQDVARFCMAYAIRQGCPEGTTHNTHTRWAVGNFDKSGEIRALLSALYPACETPNRLMEHLVNVGLKEVHGRLEQEDLGPNDLME